MLVLENNKISDAGLTAFAKAVESGALPQLKKLYLHYNQIGDVGMQALAGAVSKGALPQCTSIDLSGNPASQESKHAVKDALKRRWLDGEFLAAHFNEATSLDMSGMKWGDAEMTKLAAALIYCHAKGALDHLTVRWLPTALYPCPET